MHENAALLLLLYPSRDLAQIIVQNKATISEHIVNIRRLSHIAVIQTDRLKSSLKYCFTHLS